jgi:hypothetical protein
VFWFFKTEQDEICLSEYRNKTIRSAAWVKTPLAYLFLNTVLLEDRLESVFDVFKINDNRALLVEVIPSTRAHFDE